MQSGLTSNSEQPCSGRPQPEGKRSRVHAGTDLLISEEMDSHLRKRVRLTIVTEVVNQADPTISTVTPTSLFTASDDGHSGPVSLHDNPEELVSMEGCHKPARIWASRIAPPIPGLFFTSAIRLPSELADGVIKKCMDTYFRSKDVNQVMLFGRAVSTPLIGDSTGLLGDCAGKDTGGLPPFLMSLLSTLEELLMPVLPPHTHSLLFPPKSAPVRARQAILNLYLPGEGISAHVDLLQRFGDGILGLSLGSGCVMNFQKERREGGLLYSNNFLRDDAIGIDSEKAQDRDSWDLYLPARSVLVLSEEARYNWKHGIDAQLGDLVQCENDDGESDEPTWITRGTRLSITFRWLLPGADVVGDSI